MTVLLWGVPDESPVRLVTDALRARGTDSVTVPPQAFGVRLELGIAGDGRPEGWLQVDGARVAWDEISGVYARPVEPELAPELREAPAADPLLAHARTVYQALTGFTEVATCRVANRLSAMASNMSKPLQAQTIARCGFSIPQTLVTDSPARLRRFAGGHREVIYKSTSGIRSIVSTLDPGTDPARLDRLRWCPVQFQERVPGIDVRVHVVGDRVYAAAVDSAAVDYRYSRRQVGRDAALTAHTLADPWPDRCLALSRALDLPLAGIDLKLCPDGRVVCFEVNPSPGFSWYELEAGLPISAAIADYLAGDGPRA
jgi:hypothetical protein